MPGGALRTIPFGALMHSETGRFLVEDLPVAVAPGMTLTDPRRIPNEDLEVLSAGLSEGRQGFAPARRSPQPPNPLTAD